MSAADTLSLVCNIFQIISIARNTLNFCIEVYSGRSPDAYLEENAASLAVLSAGVETYYQGRSKPVWYDEKELASVANKCNIAARALQEEVIFLRGNQAKGSLRATLMVAFMTNWRKKRLERLQKNLNEYQKTMESRLLASVCRQSDAIEAKQSEGFKDLHSDLQAFISQYAAGHTKMSDLLRNECSQARDHVTREVEWARADIKTHITREVSNSERLIAAQVAAAGATADERRRLLRSFKFQAMNERLNQIFDSKENTFSWALRSDEAPPEQSEPHSSRQDPQAPESWDNFYDWLRSDSKLYWICGKPGSGKSTLVKHIVSEPATKAALASWKPNTAVISHFFWRPGTAMQQSMKGLLCSLIHGAVSMDPAAQEFILSTFEGAARNDSTTDWSVRELKDVCFGVLNRVGKAWCIFIDGLDEICREDGVIELMKFVDELKSPPNVKVCVASRPMPSLRKRLHSSPHLKLEDLTTTDMMNYAIETLLPRLKSHDVSWICCQVIIGLLVSKAEGVFLWLHLAIRNLLTGIDNGDGEAKLLERILNLPGELFDLYTDMWKRLIRDNSVYREETARLLTTILSAYTLSRTPLVPTSGGYFPLEANRIGTDEGPSVARLMIAMNMERFRGVLDDMESEPEPPSDLPELLEKTRQVIDTRCAGLVSIDQDARSDEGEPKARFIHRTVYDFLMEDDVGMQLHRFRFPVREERFLELLRVQLVLVRVFKHHKLPALDRSLEYVLGMLGKTITRGTIPRTNEFFQLIQRLYMSGHLCATFPNVETDRATQFLVASTRFFSTFQDSITAMIAEDSNPKALATRMLRDIFPYEDACSFSSSCQPALESFHQFLVPFLNLGADPFAPGTWNSTDEIPVGSGSDRVAVSFTSAFSRFLDFVLEHYCNYRRPGRLLLLSIIDRPLDILLRNSPTLDERSPMFINVDYDWRCDFDGNMEAVKSLISFGHSQTFFSEFDGVKGLQSGQLTVQEDPLTIQEVQSEYMDLCILLEVNSAFRVSCLLKRLAYDTYRSLPFNNNMMMPELLEDITQKLQSFRGTRKPSVTPIARPRFLLACRSVKPLRAYVCRSEPDMLGLLPHIEKWLCGQEPSSPGENEEIESAKKDILMKMARNPADYPRCSIASIRPFLATVRCGHRFADEVGDKANDEEHYSSSLLPSFPSLFGPN